MQSFASIGGGSFLVSFKDIFPNDFKVIADLAQVSLSLGNAERSQNAEFYGFLMANCLEMIRATWGIVEGVFHFRLQIGNMPTQAIADFYLLSTHLHPIWKLSELYIADFYSRRLNIPLSTSFPPGFQRLEALDDIIARLVAFVTVLSGI